MKYKIYHFLGHPEDYNEWAKPGNEGWSFSEVLPCKFYSLNNSRFLKNGK